ncbi:Uncharacterised protein [Collinsella intestinalis]|nr:Uncharacterised protein [Collinsella intestinalis]
MRVRPGLEALDCLGHHHDVVIHDPEPLGAQFVCALDAGGETARAAQVVALRSVHNARRTALGIRGVALHAPQLVCAAAEVLNHLAGLLGILVIDDDDAPRGARQPAKGVEELGEQLLTFEGHDHDRQLVDAVRGR